MQSQSYPELAKNAVERISRSEQEFTEYTLWHKHGIVRVSLATRLRVEDLGTPAADLDDVTETEFQDAQAVARQIAWSPDDPVELRVAFRIIDTVCTKRTPWIVELELYKQALITEIEHRGMYTSIPCAQNSVVSAMRALWALVLVVHNTEIHSCGALTYVIPSV
jgi:hypothetical protein